MTKRSRSTKTIPTATVRIARKAIAARHQLVFRILATICGASLIATGVAVQRHMAFCSKALDQQVIVLTEKTRSGALEINDILKDAMTAAETLADDLTSQKLSRETMLVALEESLRGNAHFYGGTITFRPFGFDPETRLYSAYYLKDGPDRDLKFQRLDEVYDYTNDDYDWYVLPMKQGNLWGEPYWDEAGKTYMTTYSAVFDLPDPNTGEMQPGGVVTIDISMDRIRKVIRNLDLGHSGFGGLTTSEGTFLYHPNDKYVTQKRNLLDVAKVERDSNGIAMAKAASKREGGIINHVSTTTGQNSWLIFEPVPISGWSLQNTYIQADFIDTHTVRRHWMLITSAATLFFLALFAILFKVQTGYPASLWLMSVTTTAIFMANIAITWGLALTYSSTETHKGAQISDHATLGWLMDAHDELCASKKRQPPAYLPTGLQIETLELVTANELTVSGLIWQRYADRGNLPAEGAAPNILIAHARSAEISEVSRKERNRETVILSKFRTTMRQQLDASEYPLDQEILTIGLLPVDGSEFALVPDLDSYKILMPSSTPGVDDDVFLAGWNIRESFFELRDSERPTNLGMERSLDEVDFPAMHYSIVVRREFVDSFISNLTPLILVAILLFAILLLANKLEYSNAFSLCVGMLFVIVFTHIGIRTKISSDHIFYLEYFYLMTYCAILGVTLNSIREEVGLKLIFLDWRECLLPRVLYWPFLLSVLTIVTFFTFYFEKV